jgi:predicted nucleic-acid-binding Zn-ribbon protein
MRQKLKCPKCGSSRIKDRKDADLDYIQCLKCGYDELEGDDVFPQQRNSQREKGRYNPYKSGRP